MRSAISALVGAEVAKFVELVGRDAGDFVDASVCDAVRGLLAGLVGLSTADLEEVASRLETPEQRVRAIVASRVLAERTDLSRFPSSVWLRREADVLEGAARSMGRRLGPISMIRAATARWMADQIDERVRKLEQESIDASFSNMISGGRSWR